QLPEVTASAPVLTSDVGVEMLSKLQRDIQLYWSSNEQFAVCDIQPIQEPTPDEAEPSTKAEKKKKRKSSKKKKQEKDNAPVNNTVSKPAEEPG
ncbi:hypothetical protein A2U01_0052045, partial [Trifolium medium]|nr:hypothetical protein [Trifolium medium]